jgi:hypothetical protein
MSELYDHLLRNSLQVVKLEKNILPKIQREWLDLFASNVKSEKGSWVYNGYMWHGFSFGLEQNSSGSKAFDCYAQEPLEKCYAFDEDIEECYEFIPNNKFPDLTILDNDYYILPVSKKWTMVFTHEQPSIGPFFARNRLTSH